MSKKIKPAKQAAPEFINEAARELFATHTCDAFYFTADGTAFSKLHHAELHAHSLKQTEIQTITRKEVNDAPEDKN
ncbi:MAG TPA: hypothetical protein VFC92_06585 [Bacteroidales bacterium]|jgi:hypothetical protein|nr:hypothetical protein [Bacteroidales bacterium]